MGYFALLSAAYAEFRSLPLRTSFRSLHLRAQKPMIWAHYRELPSQGFAVLVPEKLYAIERTDMWPTEGIHAPSSGGCIVRVTSWRIQSGCSQSPNAGAEPPMLFSKSQLNSLAASLSFSVQRALSTVQTFTKVLSEKTPHCSAEV